MTAQPPSFCSVYGPVPSWRFGRSLGIDPIGPVSTCSFNCAYCQLGEIQRQTLQRQIFMPTQQIRQDLQAFAPWEVDVVTLSGSGEPTLALNLAEILAAVEEIAGRPRVVLTNGTLLGDAAVRQDLAKANIVAAKLDAISDEQLQRVNRPVAGLDWAGIWAGLEQFRRDWPGQLAIQTMVLSPWPPESRAQYASLMRQLQPDEIQLNTPTRPRPLDRQVETRGARGLSRPYEVQVLKPASRQVLQDWARELEEGTGIPVRCVPLAKLWGSQNYSAVR